MSNHLPDSQIRNLTVLESLNLKSDLINNSKLLINDTTDGISNDGSIKTFGGISSAKNVFAGSFSLLDPVSHNVSISKGTGSPDSCIIKFGDHTGWKFKFNANTGEDCLSITDTGNLSVSGFTSLGNGNIQVKMLNLSGTFPSSPNSFVNIAHGLDWSKIISCNVLVKTTSGGIQPIIPPLFTISANLEYNFQITATDIVVFSNSNSANLFGCPIRITVIYSN